MPIHLSRRKFLKIGLFSGIGAAFAGGSTFVYAHNIEPGWVEIVNREFFLPRLSPVFDGYKLVQFSDIHMGTGMSSERLNYIVDLVNEQEADAVAVTGDFVTEGSVEAVASSLIQPLSRLKAKDRAVAILGNHDHWTDPQAVRQIIYATNLLDINNRVSTIQRGAEMLHLAGVDDYWERKDDLIAVLNALPADGAAILLAHEPDYADISAATRRFDLQISGHSHGGQVILPIINRPFALPLYSHKYPLGQYQVGEMIQYTNRGVGTIRPAVRFNCRPEITVFTLRALAG